MAADGGTFTIVKNNSFSPNLFFNPFPFKHAVWLLQIVAASALDELPGNAVIA
jgi:hypothetical protein